MWTPSLLAFYFVLYSVWMAADPQVCIVYFSNSDLFSLFYILFIVCFACPSSPSFSGSYLYQQGEKLILLSTHNLFAVMEETAF